MAISRGAAPRSRAFPPRCARPRKAGSARRSRRACAALAAARRLADGARRRAGKDSAMSERKARMIRVVAFLVATALLALGVVWLADRPGQVAITWLGYRTDTSVMVAMVAIGAVALAAIMLWSLLRWLFRSPKLFSLAVRERQRRKGYDAISRGLIAIGAGDARAAHAPRRTRREEPAGRAAGAAAARADRAAQRRPRRRRGGVPRHGGALRHAAARPARAVRRGAAPQRRGRGAAVRRAGRQGCARARLGRPGGARIPLPGRRLGRRARDSGEAIAATA